MRLGTACRIKEKTHLARSGRPLSSKGGMRRRVFGLASSLVVRWRRARTLVGQRLGVFRAHVELHLDRGGAATWSGMQSSSAEKVSSTTYSSARYAGSALRCWNRGNKKWPAGLKSAARDGPAANCGARVVLPGASKRPVLDTNAPIPRFQGTQGLPRREPRNYSVLEIQARTSSQVLNEGVKAPLTRAISRRSAKPSIPQGMRPSIGCARVVTCNPSVDSLSRGSWASEGSARTG